MLKVFTLAVMLVFFSACSQKENVKPTHATSKHKQMKKMQKHTKMFQTVAKKDAILVQEGKNKNSCAICGMNLTKFYKTSHIVVHEDKPVQYCSLHCLADHLGEGVEVKNPKVVDVKSLKFIPVLEAYYVVGSDVHGTMSRVSKYAFQNLEDAKKFQKLHGGKIMDFYGALEKAKEDF